MSMSLRFTIDDLDVLPENGKRYEIIDGELYVSSQPDFIHQQVSSDVWLLLQNWSDAHNTGEACVAPGVIFADDDVVAPDVIWMSWRRLAEARRPGDGHLHAPPELVVEVLSPGSANERRDRVAKLKLYSRRGVDEYWIADWRTQTIDVYRRVGEGLTFTSILAGEDSLESPLLPDFKHPVSFVFRTLRRQAPR
jgi:Uma2 family endonuclease